jgi:hypothetical protein
MIFSTEVFTELATPVAARPLTTSGFARSFKIGFANFLILFTTLAGCAADPTHGIIDTASNPRLST